MLEPEFKNLRVMTVGGKPHSVRVLRTVLNLAGIIEIVHATDVSRALMLLKTQMYDAVFCDEQIDTIDGKPFAVAARREPDVWNNMIPIFLTCSAARRRQVEAAREIGITDVLARPVTAATIMRKLTLVLTRPRSFIVAPGFYGPDRRGKVRPEFQGDDRRARKARQVKVAKPTRGDDYFV